MLAVVLGDAWYEEPWSVPIGLWCFHFWCQRERALRLEVSGGFTREHRYGEQCGHAE